MPKRGRETQTSSASVMGTGKKCNGGFSLESLVRLRGRGGTAKKSGLEPTLSLAVPSHFCYPKHSERKRIRSEDSALGARAKYLCAARHRARERFPRHFVFWRPLYYCKRSQERNRPGLTAEDVVRPRVSQSRDQVSEVFRVATIRLSGGCET